MKELTIEEKAKAYDEAIGVINKCETDKYGCLLGVKPADIFPELKEGEDERIRKGLIGYLKECRNQCRSEVMISEYAKWIAWLERQGNLVKYYEDKLDRCACYNFNKGYKKALEAQGKNNMGISESTKQELEDNLNKSLEKETPESWNEFLDEQGEQKLYVNGKAKEMFIKALERVEEQNNKGYKLTDCDKNSWWEDFKTYCGYNEIKKPIEPDDLIEESYQQQADDLIDMVTEKPAWSENDENAIKVLRNIIRKSEMIDSIIYTDSLKEKLYDWVKSIKDRVQVLPQNRWKPSDKQMSALDSTLQYNRVSRNSYEHLNSLFNDLKKLKE